jgi:hypothetical protein
MALCRECFSCGDNQHNINLNGGYLIRKQDYDMEKKNLIYSVMLWTMFGARTMAYTCSYESAKAIADDLLDIFRQLYEAHYIIESIRLIDDYEADDEQSMRANNTSCFCFRSVAGSNKLSRHSMGMAVDINPLYNPCVRLTAGGIRTVQPGTATPYADRRGHFPMKITKRDQACRLFTSHGFHWGGAWRSVKDYQHFEK